MSSKGSPFIPVWFDELQLTSSEYRVLIHLWRRSDRQGTCFPSVPSVITCCRLTENTVWKALRVLEARGLVKRERRLRTSNLYRLIIPDTAIEAASEDRETPQIERHQAPQSSGCQIPQSAGCKTPQRKGCKGSPMKVPQTRFPNEEGEGLSTLPEKLSDIEVETLSSNFCFEREAIREGYEFFRQTKLLFKADWAHLRRRDLPAAVGSFFRTDRRGREWLEQRRPTPRRDYTKI